MGLYPFNIVAISVTDGTAQIQNETMDSLYKVAPKLRSIVESLGA